MFETFNWMPFLIVFVFQYLQYDIFEVFSSNAVLFHWHLHCNPFTREEDCIQNFSRTYMRLAITVFGGPYFIANHHENMPI